MTRRTLYLAAALLIAVLASGRAQAGDSSKDRTNAAIRALVGFLAPGGYFPTGRAARDEFGSAKWAGEMSLFVKPKRVGALLLTGGFDRFAASDRFLPFSGGNEFSLTGAAARVTMPDRVGGVRPVVTAGLYAGYLRCDSIGVATTRVVPSASIGIEWKAARSIVVAADYRVSTPIGGLSVNGWGLYLKLF